MAVKVFGRFEVVAVGDGPRNLQRYYICDTADDLPSSGLLAGDKAMVIAMQARYTCYNGTAWTSDAGQAGPHTHPESDVVDLVTHLAGKAASTHSHSPTDVTGTAVITTDSRLSDARTPTAHGHAQSEVTGLVDALAGKLATTALVGVSKITVGTGQPGSPTTGDLWVDTN